MSEVLPIIESHKLLRIDHEWIIYRFTSRTREKDAIYGPEFKHGNHKFALKIEVEHDLQNYSRDKLFFQLEKLSPMPIDVELFSIRLIGSNNTEMPFFTRKEVFVYALQGSNAALSNIKEMIRHKCVDRSIIVATFVIKTFIRWK